MTPLMYAASRNPSAEVLKELIDSGANVRLRDKEDMTALMHAARTGANPQVLELLLDSGADKSAATEEGKKAVDFAEMNPRISNSGVFERLR